MKNRRRGLTIVEILVATILLGVGMVAIAGTTAAVVRYTRLSRDFYAGTILAANALDSLRSVPCASIIAGAVSDGQAAFSWSATERSGARQLLGRLEIRGRAAAPRPIVSLLPCFP
jgi:Tfp pilus assembly protein PilV